VGTFGALSGTATDGNGNSYTVYFDVGSAVNIYLSLNTTPSTLTTAQRAAVVTELQEFTQQAWTFGATVKTIPLLASVLNNVAGITDIPSYGIGTSASPTGTGNIAILPNQIAVLPVGNILVNGT
jgi:hypothetical protein